MPIDEFKLQLEFSNGEIGVYDCTHLLDFGVFTELKDKDYFRQVRVKHGTVVWPHEQDICPDTLFIDSQKSREHAMQASEESALYKTSEK